MRTSDIQKSTAYLKSGIAAIGLVLMIGCDSGGGGETDVGSGIGSIQENLITGQFIDGPVAGLNYECSSGITGVTNTNGKYTCKKNDTVTFRVGNVILGSAPAESIITPVSLYPDNPEAATNVAQLLQTLDDDGDLSTFVIDESKSALLDPSLDVTSSTFDADVEAMLFIPIVDETTATAHLNESLAVLPGAQQPTLAAPTVEPVPSTEPAPVVGVEPTPTVEPAPIVTEPAPSTEPAPIVTEPTPTVEPAPIVTEPAPSIEPAPVVGVEPTPVVEPAPLVEPAPSSLNLISNGTFDMDVTGWTGNNGIVSHASAISGRDNVLAIADSGGEFSSATQSFPTTVGTQYEIVGLKYYNGNLIECDLRIYSGQWSAAAGDLLNVVMPKSPAWETLDTQTFTATSSTTTIALMSRGADTAYFDDVLVRPAATQPTAVDAIASTTNPYLEEVTLPSCDTNNPEVQLISSNADWSHINDSNKRIFCVSPGDYSSLGIITLSSSGTQASPRYIVLNNGNDTHPAKLSTQAIANVRLTFNNANYWVLDRMSTVNYTTAYSYIMKFVKSSHNILNRCYFNNNWGGINIADSSNNNTIQHSRMSNMTLAGRQADRIGINLAAEGRVYSVEIKNTKIIENEFVNCSDSFQAVRHNNPDLQLYDANYEGTIIDSNDMYIDSSIYTDGKGNSTPIGKYAYAENAIDLKAGSENASNPMIITNNHFWGYRKSDKTNSQLSDWGSAIAIHYGVKNLLFKNNWIFDSARAIGAGDKQRFPHALSYSEISNNNFYNNSIPSTTNYSMEYVSFLYENTSNVKYTKNNHIGTKTAKWFSNDGTLVNSEISCNIVVNSLGHTGSFAASNIISHNVYFDTIPLKQDTGFISDPNIAHALLEDYSFTTDKFTNNPRTILLKNALPKAQLPNECY